MKSKKTYFIITFLFILIIYKIDFLRSLHDTIIINYDDRISKTYGFCDREGIGYVNFIKKKFNVNDKIEIRNSLRFNSNNSGIWSVYNPNLLYENIKGVYLIVINYNKLKDKIDLNNYKILHKYEDCYFLVKND